MTEDALRQALSFDAPAARDPAFTLAVLERAARVHARRRLAERTFVWAVFAVGAAVLAPGAAEWLAADEGAGSVVLLAAAALMGTTILRRLMPRPARA